VAPIKQTVEGEPGGRGSSTNQQLA